MRVVLCIVCRAVGLILLYVFPAWVQTVGLVKREVLRLSTLSFLRMDYNRLVLRLLYCHQLRFLSSLVASHWKLKFIARILVMLV